MGRLHSLRKKLEIEPALYPGTTSVVTKWGKMIAGFSL
jgi:hypothetical protein